MLNLPTVLSLLIVLSSPFAFAAEIDELIDVDLPDFRVEEPSFKYLGGVDDGGLPVFLKVTHDSHKFQLGKDWYFWNGSFVDLCGSSMAKHFDVDCQALPLKEPTRVSAEDYQFAKDIYILKRDMVDYEGVTPELRVFDFKVQQLSEFVLAQSGQCPGWLAASDQVRSGWIREARSWFADTFKDLSSLRFKAKRLKTLSRVEAESKVIRSMSNLFRNIKFVAPDLQDLGQEATRRAKALIGRIVTEEVSSPELSQIIQKSCN
ncbi:MAG: hypothetical protein H6624_07395 [Bdellovibrionaceae bacterium]|nr:hypothetical protein [Bdellovibrionales bacterium]MCB9084153.1 hypothetical protein [Pseudobdellovibrionaceae bacterium]